MSPRPDDIPEVEVLYLHEIDLHAITITLQLPSRNKFPKKPWRRSVLPVQEADSNHGPRGRVSSRLQKNRPRRRPQSTDRQPSVLHDEGPTLVGLAKIHHGAERALGS
jgi:hypothetical protein